MKKESLDTVIGAKAAPEEHRTEVCCEATVEEALAFLDDGLQLGRWALGCWDTMYCDHGNDGIVRGHSLFDGLPCFARPVIDAAARRVIYLVGASPKDMHPRIQVDVFAQADDRAPRCTLVLRAQRPPGMDDARWQRLVRCHEVEVLLIQAQLLARRRGGITA